MRAAYSEKRGENDNTRLYRAHGDYFYVFKARQLHTRFFFLFFVSPGLHCAVRIYARIYLTLFFVSSFLRYYDVSVVRLVLQLRVATY